MLLFISTTHTYVSLPQCISQYKSFIGLRCLGCPCSCHEHGQQDQELLVLFPQGACFALGRTHNQRAILPAKKGCFRFAASSCILLSYLPCSLRGDCDKQIAQPPARAVPLPATADPITAVALLD